MSHILKRNLNKTPIRLNKVIAWHFVVLLHVHVAVSCEKDNLHIRRAIKAIIIVNTSPSLSTGLVPLALCSHK